MAADEGIHRGITGIMANRLTGKHTIPAMVVHLGKERVIVLIRSPGNYDIRLLLEPIDDILLNYGTIVKPIYSNSNQRLINSFQLKSTNIRLVITVNPKFFD